MIHLLASGNKIGLIHVEFNGTKLEVRSPRMENHDSWGFAISEDSIFYAPQHHTNAVHRVCEGNVRHTIAMAGASTSLHQMRMNQQGALFITDPNNGLYRWTAKESAARMVNLCPTYVPADHMNSICFLNEDVYLSYHRCSRKTGKVSTVRRYKWTSDYNLEEIERIEKGRDLHSLCVMNSSTLLACSSIDSAIIGVNTQIRFDAFGYTRGLVARENFLYFGFSQVNHNRIDRGGGDCGIGVINRITGQRIDTLTFKGGEIRDIALINSNQAGMFHRSLNLIKTL